MDGDGDTSEAFLRENWEELCSSILGRSFLRAVIVPHFQLHGMTLTTTLEMSAHASTNAPDILYALSDVRRNDLHLLLAVERCHAKFLCNPPNDESPPLAAAVDEALSLNFFARTFLLSMRWHEEMSRRVTQSEWAIPPLDMRALHSWHVSEREFQQRLDWVAPWLRRFLRHPTIRQHDIVLSGGIIPLCVLRQEVFVEDADSFLRYADEIYRNTSIDLFVKSDSENIDRITSDVCAVLADAEQRPVHVSSELWVEDDETWVRRRRGTSVGIDTASGRRVTLVFMTSTVTESIAHQHLPCVRASYDGSTLSVTASCFVAWMTRFIGEPLLFGNHVSTVRRSKTVLKYAIRGFGFSPTALVGCVLPSTISLWLRDEVPRHRPLPWYHILYQPALWRKAMTAQRERDLLACIES